MAVAGRSEELDSLAASFPRPKLALYVVMELGVVGRPSSCDRIDADGGEDGRTPFPDDEDRALA